MEENNFDKSQEEKKLIRFIPFNSDKRDNFITYYNTPNNKSDDSLFDSLKEKGIITVTQKSVIPVYHNGEYKNWIVSNDIKTQIIDQIHSLNTIKSKWYIKLFNSIKKFIFKILKLKIKNHYKIYITKNRRGKC